MTLMMILNYWAKQAIGVRKHATKSSALPVKSSHYTNVQIFVKYLLSPCYFVLIKFKLIGLSLFITT